MEVLPTAISLTTVHTSWSVCRRQERSRTSVQVPSSGRHITPWATPPLPGETGTCPNGPCSIPVSIPFNTIGSDFQIELELESFESTEGADVWDADYADTMTVSLTAPNGVTLY